MVLIVAHSVCFFSLFLCCCFLFLFSLFLGGGVFVSCFLMQGLQSFLSLKLSRLVKEIWPQGYKVWVHSQTQNKAQWLAVCGHVSASSQSLRFILSLRLYQSFITSRPGCLTRCKMQNTCIVLYHCIQLTIPDLIHTVVNLIMFR